MTSSRSPASKARKNARSKARRAERGASHPFLDPQSLAMVRGLQDPGQTILSAIEDAPDRSEYRRDPDRQAAIEAHARRVAAVMGRA